MIKLTLSALIYPTENRNTIAELFNKIYEFPSFEVKDVYQEGVSVLYAEAQGLETLKYLFQQVRRQQTVEAVRRQVLYRMDLNNNSVWFYIHKQALSTGKIVLCHKRDESPLGPIKVEIEADNIEAVINYLYPPTKNGKVLEVNYVPH